MGSGWLPVWLLARFHFRGLCAENTMDTAGLGDNVWLNLLS